jgi:hypothetical protein
MTPKQCQRTLAHHAAAHLATELLLARCRTGAELAMMPQGRWLGAASQGLYDWLQAGGFGCEIEAGARDTAQYETNTATGTKTATSGRRSLAPVGSSEE